jgi:hypothetical protein
MTNELFVIEARNIVSVWAPINSWEPHVLYQRTAINLEFPQSEISPRSDIPGPLDVIIIHGADFTKALETVFNQSTEANRNTALCENIEKIVDIARKAPDICLVISPREKRLAVWEINVSPKAVNGSIDVKQVDCVGAKPVTACKILEESVPLHSLSNSAGVSLFWCFSVGPHGNTGNLRFAVF